MCVLLNGKSRGVGWVIPTGQNSVNEGILMFCPDLWRSLVSGSAHFSHECNMQFKYV